MVKSKIKIGNREYEFDGEVEDVLLLLKRVEGQKKSEFEAPRELEGTEIMPVFVEDKTRRESAIKTKKAKWARHVLGSGNDRVISYG